jgi:hypothetical protein
MVGCRLSFSRLHSSTEELLPFRHTGTVRPGVGPALALWVWAMHSSALGQLQKKEAEQEIHDETTVGCPGRKGGKCLASACQL